MTTTTTTTTKNTALGSLLVASLFIVLGGITLYDTLSYSDMDSKVFPRAAAILLIVASIASIFLSLLKPATDEGFGDGSWWRRALLVCAMLGACILMPVCGFITASGAAFIGALIAANHNQWQLRSAIIYFISGAAVVGGFYALFRFGLSVPLP